MIDEESNLKLLKLTFPTIYGIGSNDDNTAALLFQKAIKFLEKEKSLFSKERQKKEILARLTKALPDSDQNSVKIIWKCEYGCSVVIRKAKKESQIDIKIVVPEEWGSGAHDWTANKFQHCQPQGQSTFHLPLVAENHVSLDQFYKNFCYQLNSAIADLLQKDEHLTKDSSVIEKACKKVAHLESYSTSYNDIVNQGETKDQNKNDKVFSAEIPNMKVQNTCWYVPEATIVDLITRNSPAEDWPAAEKLIIGFKGHLLENVTRERAEKVKYDQREVADFKRCLDQLIEKYKKNISIKTDEQINKYKDFKKFIGKIYDQLKVITSNGLTSKIDDFQEEKGKLKFEEPKIATIEEPQQKRHKAQEIILVKIDEFPLKVEKRLVFEQLLEIGQGIQEKDFIEKDKWVLLVERTLFSLTEEFNTNKQRIDLYIHMREIQCEKDASNLCLLVQKYEKLLTLNEEHQKHFGNMMKGQTRSHIQLVKTIGSIVAFESVKMNREKKKSHLKDYRIPINIDNFYKGFISHSYEARRAMKNIFKYHEIRKNKKQLFQLNGSSKSFSDYAKLVAQQTRSAKVWFDNMQKILRLKQQLLFTNVKLQQSNKRLQGAIAQLQRLNGVRSPYYSRGKHENQTYTQYITSVFAQFNENDPWLFAFVENIPPDILGMMKIFYMAQNPIKDLQKGSNNIFTEHFIGEKFPITLQSSEPNLDQNYINTGTLKVQSIPIAKYFNDVKIIFDGSSNGKQLKPNMFQDYRKLFFSQQLIEKHQGKIQYIMHQPNDQTTKNRQHRLYAKQNDKPDQIELEDFLAVGNIRSAQNTQLIVLCSNILQRRLISNSYSKVSLLAEQTFLQTTGQLFNYQPDTEKYFKHIRTLMSQFIKIWAYTDVTFCPTIGPFFGYMSRALIDDEIPTEEELQTVNKIVFRICLKCLEEYEKGQAQLKNKPNEKVQWYQRFTLTAAVVCLREIILKPEDQQETLMLCNIIFSLRSTQIMSGRQEKPDEMRPFHEELAFSISKTVYYNIQTISNLLIQKPQCIGNIVKKLDPSYQEQFTWERQNIFSFYGKSQKIDDIYQIDLYLGKIFKNGKQISALDPIIKGKPDFIEIFGKDRQFQVFQSNHAHFLRTKNSVNHQFKIPQTKGLIFFEFSQDGDQIRYVFRKNGGSSKDQEIWVLVKKQDLVKSNCFIPKLFFDHYKAWYSKKRRCIMFRKTNFEQIYHAGIVIHLSNSEGKMQIEKAFYINYHGSFENQDLDELCDKETKKYSEIILRSKDNKPDQVNCFKLLNKFESPQYILELRNGNKIEYYLHRYQSKFWLEDETRLSSETYFGYSLDYSFYQNKACIFNKFPCLVLQKHSKNQALLNSHKRIVVISQGEVLYGGKIKKTPKADENIGSFKYEIHDFFGDLRGANRQSLLHLSAIMLSINDNMKVTSIEMTPLDYSIHLLKSCLSNRPFGKKDIQQMEKVVKNLHPPQSYMLLLECIWTCSKALIGILPFKEQKIRSIFNEMHEKQLMNCRNIYKKKIGKQILRFRQKISLDLLNFIGMSLSENKIYGNLEETPEPSSSSQDSSQSSEESQPVKQKDYWKNLKEYTGKKQKEQFAKLISQYKEFDNIAKDVCKIWKEKLNKNQKKKMCYRNESKNLFKVQLAIP